MKAPENRIAEWRQVRGWSQGQLAERARTTTSTISKLEGGRMRITHAWMIRLSAALRCRPAEILFDGPAPARAVDAELLRRAYDVVTEILACEPEAARRAAFPDFLAAMYEVLADAEAQGRVLDEAAIHSIVMSNRAIWGRLKPK